METRTSYCKFNKIIDCSTKECQNCGWNPDVKEKRVDEWMRNRKRETKEE